MQYRMQRIVAGLAFALLAASALAAPRPGDTVCLVSTRPVGCSTDAARLATGVYGATYDGAWRDSDAAATLASLDPATPVVIYVHGNRIAACEARSRGLAVYKRLLACRCDDRPIQFVIFSWCSDKEAAFLRDYRIKAARTRPVAWQLAWTIDRLPPGASVGVLGYSYGARVSSGAAHLLGGGALSGLAYNEADDCDGCRRPMRAVFLAAAMDACWLAPNRYHGLTLTQLDSLLVTLDPEDPAMRFFKFVPRLNDPPALGDIGPRGLDAYYATKVRTRNVEAYVGRSHDLFRYLAVPGLMRSAWQRLTFADTQPATPATPTLAAASGETDRGA